MRLTSLRSYGHWLPRASLVLLSSCVIYDVSEGATPSVSWTKVLSTGSHDLSYAIAVDNSGNAFVGGESLGTLAGTNSGGWDGFVGHLDASTGATRWLRQFGTAADDAVEGVATDGLGGVFVAGGTSGSLEGAGAGGSDAYVRRYANDGAVAWTRQFGTSASDVARDVAVDSQGRVYVAGQTDGSLGGLNLGSRDGFVRKYDATGTLEWSTQVGTSLFDVAQGVAVDSAGNSFAAGFSVAGGGALPTGNQDAFVSKLDPAGNVLWLRSFGTIARDRAEDVATDALGNVFVAGSIGEESAAENSLHSDAFLAKYDASGNQVWFRRWGDAKREDGLAVATDPLGNAYLGGRVLSPSDGAVTKAGAFVAKFTSDGDLAWEYLRESPVYVEVWGLAADAQGGIYMTATQAAIVGVNYDVLVVKLQQVAEPGSFLGAFIGFVALVGAGRRRADGPW